jgi:hypothetical protein
MLERGKRGVGPKRCVRRSVSLSNEYDSKLNKLAVSCGMAPATLATLLIQLCLDSPNTVNYLQGQYNKNPQYRVVPIRESNKVIY